jgi:hypothetical protein
MDPTGILITADVAVVLVLLYVLDRNVFHALDLLFSYLPSAIGGAYLRAQLQARLWLDRQALVHRGPVGRLWNEYCLWRIRNNPAYKEFFQNRDEQV